MLEEILPKNESPLSESSIPVSGSQGADMILANGPSTLPINSVPQWYHVKNQQKVGPVSLNQLTQLTANGELGPDDMVWRKGMTEWTIARNVTELNYAKWTSQPISDTPPPFMVEPNEEEDDFEVVKAEVAFASPASVESGVIQGIPVEEVIEGQALPLPESTGRRAKDEEQAIRSLGQLFGRGRDDDGDRRSSRSSEKLPKREKDEDDTRPAKPRKTSRSNREGLTMLVSSGGINEEYETLGVVTAFASVGEGFWTGNLNIQSVYDTALATLIGNAQQVGANGLLFVNFQGRDAAVAGIVKAKRGFEVFAWGTAVKIS